MVVDQKMAERLRDHLLVLYMAFIMPVALLVIGVLAKASVLFIILVAAWLGAALILFFLPLASDNGTGA